MIVTHPEAYLTELARRPFPASAKAVPHGVFMVMPERFWLDPESAADNAYMNLDLGIDPGRARAQAEALADRIEAVGVPVVRFAGDPETPDAVFPNNVFATAPGRFIVGRMRHARRRREAAHREIRDHFAERQLVDLSHGDAVAELTGPLVIDRGRGIGFCGMSERVDEAGLAAMHEAFDLRLTFRFDLAPGEYHTNVVLSVLAGRAAILCPEGFADSRVPEAVSAAFPGRCLPIDPAEKHAFVANCIALTDRDLFMSQTAAAALKPHHRAALDGWGFEVHAVDVSELEKAGGSLRCMVAEIY